MATDRVNDPRAFKNFLDEKLSDGMVKTLDEALGLWEYENQAVEEREATIKGIREGLADVEAGRVMPAREAISRLRGKYRNHGLGLNPAIARTGSKSSQP